MIKINAPDGYYLRPIDRGDVNWLLETLADWPVPDGAGPMFPQEVCRGQVSYPMARMSPAILADKRGWNGVWWVLCSSDDVPLGGIRCSHVAEGGTVLRGFDIEYAAVHPDHRGQGNFSRLHSAIAWFANKYLETATARMYVADDVPQVISRGAKRNAVVASEKPSAREGHVIREEVMSRAEVAKSWEPGEDRAFSLDLGVSARSVTTPSSDPT